MSLPYYPFYPKDYEAKTAHLTMAEDGAYSRLLRLCWMTSGCSIPADEKWIMRHMRAHTDEEKEAVQAVLDEFFQCKGGRFSNASQVEIFEASSEAHKKRKSAGSKGGKAKALKTKQTEAGNAKAMLKQPEPEPEPYSNIASYEATAILEAKEAYNITADFAGWPKCQKMTKAREARLKKRLHECGGIEGWKVAMDRASRSDFLCNRASSSFTASMDFLLRESSFTKLMEGNYDNRSSGGRPRGGPDGGTGRPGSGTAEAFANVAARMSGQPGTGGGNFAPPSGPGESGLANGPGDLFAKPIFREGDAESGQGD